MRLEQGRKPITAQDENGRSIMRSKAVPRDSLDRFLEFCDLTGIEAVSSGQNATREEKADFDPAVSPCRSL